MLNGRTTSNHSFFLHFYSLRITSRLAGERRLSKPYGTTLLWYPIPTILHLLYPRLVIASSHSLVVYVTPYQRGSRETSGLDRSTTAMMMLGGRGVTWFFIIALLVPPVAHLSLAIQ